MPKIAIIGAGLSGLILANELHEHAEITLFEKSRGVGGRMATRYTESFEFDHGAPYFKAESKDFLNFLSPFIEKGIVKAWNDTPYYVACPRMNALAKSLSHGLRIELNHKVEDIDELKTRFDWIISTAPYPQTKALFPKMPNFPIDIKACFSLMLGFKSPLPINENILSLNNLCIGQVIINSNKPNRPEAYSIVVHTTPEWSHKNLERDDEWVKMQILNELRHFFSYKIIPVHIALHRWRYAKSSPHDETYLWIDDKNHLAAVGDWSMQGDVEGAYHAATSLAIKIRERIKNTST